MATKEDLSAKDEEIASLKEQLESAHSDRVNAEKERDDAKAVVSPPIEKREIGALHCTIEIPSDLHEYKGEYVEIATGAIYGLKILKPEEVRCNKTHIVKNATHGGDYTAEEFRARYDKK